MSVAFGAFLLWYLIGLISFGLFILYLALVEKDETTRRFSVADIFTILGFSLFGVFTAIFMIMCISASFFESERWEKFSNRQFQFKDRKTVIIYLISYLAVLFAIGVLGAIVLFGG